MRAKILYHENTQFARGWLYCGIDTDQRLAQAVEMLPDEKREFILGYAEGVIAMANELRASNTQAQASA